VATRTLVIFALALAACAFSKGKNTINVKPVKKLTADLSGYKTLGVNVFQDDGAGFDPEVELTRTAVLAQLRGLKRWKIEDLSANPGAVVDLQLDVQVSAVNRVSKSERKKRGVMAGSAVVGQGMILKTTDPEEEIAGYSVVCGTGNTGIRSGTTEDAVRLTAVEIKKILAK